MHLKTKSRIASSITAAYFIIGTLISISIIHASINTIGFFIIYAMIIGFGALFKWFLDYTENIRAMIENKK